MTLLPTDGAEFAALSSLVLPTPCPTCSINLKFVSPTLPREVGKRETKGDDGKPAHSYAGRVERKRGKIKK